MLPTSHRLYSQLKHSKPALIFFDIDGTLLNTQGQYSPELKTQLQRLHHRGVKLAIASGRPAIAAQFLFDDLPLTDAGLFCTGAEVYHPKEQRHFYHHSLDHISVNKLYQSIKAEELYCEFYTLDHYATERDDDISQEHSEHLRITPRQIAGDDFLEQRLPMTKLLLGENKNTQAGKLEALAAEFTQFEFAFAHFLPRPDWLFASVVSKAADKRQGFQALIDYHQVNADEVMAFGDSHSDTIFLQSAGIGVAMGNASDDIKCQADFVTLSADDNGVAAALACI